MNDSDDRSVLVLTTDIVSAYLAHNRIANQQVDHVIQVVHTALNHLNTQGQGSDFQPAVPIDKSATPDYMVCLEDGGQFKMLKRHLATAHGLTPTEYRKKWRLPPHYPMTAPNYAKHRSRLATKFAFGRANTGRHRRRARK